MAAKEQEAAIDERIERIRKRNEEIQRRYLEVEADKKNAEKLNAAVKFTPPDVNVDRKPFTRPSPVNRNPKVERKIPDKQYVPKPQTPGKKYSEFSDGDGPPPDPVYTFLSDHSRDQPKGETSPDAKFTKDYGPDDEFRGHRGRGRGRGWTRGRGSPGRGSRGGRGGGGVNNQSPRQGPQMQPEYQAWRAEREKIDEARITRQKTAEGNWRREWDSEKISQDENQKFQARPVFSKKKRRDSDEMKIQRTVVNDLAVSSPPSRENDSKHSDKPIRHDRESPGEKKASPFIFRGGASSNDTDENPEDVMEYQHRNIVSFGDSIKISLSNKPIKSVRVNPINTAGTGRVGPRQKPRLSYSSQSEDEKEMHAPIIRRRVPAFNVREQQDMKTEAARKLPPLPPARTERENHSPRKKQAPVKIPTMVFGEPETLAVDKKDMSKGSSHENVSEGGDDSWEDVGTTSGNESAEYSDGEATRSDEGGKASVKDKVVDDGKEEGAAVKVEVSDEVKEVCGQGQGSSSDESNGKKEEVSEVMREGVKNESEEVGDVANSEDVDNIGETKEGEYIQRESETAAESTKESDGEGIRLGDECDPPSEESMPTVPTENERPGVEEGCDVEKEEPSPIRAAEGVNICREESLEKSMEDKVESDSSDQRGNLQSEPSAEVLELKKMVTGCPGLKEGIADENFETADDGSKCDEKAGQRIISNKENLSHISTMNSDKSP